MLSTTLTPFVLPQDLDVFSALQADLHQAIQPTGVFEHFAFDRLVNAAWNMRRVSTAEISLLDRSNGEDPLLHPDTAADARRFASLTRGYESSYSRTYKELVDLQSHRALRNLDAELPPLADPVKVARLVKQRQAIRARDLDIEWKAQDVELQKRRCDHYDREYASKPVAQVQPAQHSAVQSLPPQPKVETIVRDTPKIGRNQLCPCGSGLKFKRCCGNPVKDGLAQTA